MWRCILIYFLIIFMPQSLFTQEPRWIESEGHASMSELTQYQARTQALQEARAEAVRMVAGAKIQAENFRIRTENTIGEQTNELRDFFATMIRDVAFGQIIHEDIITEGPIPVSPGTRPEFYYKVKIKALVAIEKGEPDPAFRVDVKTNKSIYLEKEQMTIDIRASQDCYVHVFNILQNDSILVLYPNRYMRYNQLKANVTLHLMPAGLTLEMYLLPGSQKAIEYIYVVATKEYIEFMSGWENAPNAFQALATKSFTALELPKWLSKIRPHKRTDCLAAYQIFRSLKSDFE